MATIAEILKALSAKGKLVSTADLAKELNASNETTLKQLTREKDKENVDGNSQEGWQITDRGRTELEKGIIHPSMLEAGVTPRQQFEAIGRRIGLKDERITLSTDIVWSGDYSDVVWCWKALGQADLADDLRQVWVNAWRAKLHKSIPPELETQLGGLSKTEVEVASAAASDTSGIKEYIILDDMPVRVGVNLGDYSLKDAKDLLTIRALKTRFSGIGQGVGEQAGTGQGVTAGVGTNAERVSDLLTALEPYLNKGNNDDTLKALIATQLELQKHEILSMIPAPAIAAQPKTFVEGITEMVTAVSKLKEVGPIVKTMLGIPEPSAPSTQGVPVQIAGPDGKPLIMDLGKVMDWSKFQAEERRADERHGALMGLAKVVRENVSDGVSAMKAAAEEVKGTGKDAPSQETTPQVFACGNCQQEFSAPVGWDGQSLMCPTCNHQFTKEELLA